MKFDKPLVAIVLSILGAFPAGIFLELMRFFHLITISVFEAMSMMFIRQGSTALGILSYIGYSSVLGLILYYSPKILGTDYFPVKALFVSMVAESILFIVFGTLVRNEFMLQNAVGNYLFATAAAIGGFCRGFLIKNYIFDKSVQPN